MKNLIEQNKEIESQIKKYCVENSILKSNHFINEITVDGVIIKNNLLSGKKKSWKDIRDSLITPDFVPFRRGYVNNLTGQGGVGKSMFTLQLSIIHILNERIEHGRDVNVLFWSCEDLYEDIADRFKVICEEILKLTLSDIEYVNERLTVIDGDSNVFKTLDKDKKVSKEFKEFEESSKNFDLIILDPLVRFFSACGLDENNNVDANSFMSPFVEMASSNKQTIIFVSHSSKGSINIRGAQGFVDAFRYSVSIHKFEEVLLDDENRIVRDLRTNEILYREIAEKRHLREIRIFKDNSNIAGFIKMNKDQFVINSGNYSSLTVKIFEKEKHYIDSDEDYYFPENRFILPSVLEDEEFDRNINDIY